MRSMTKCHQCGADVREGNMLHHIQHRHSKPMTFQHSRAICKKFKRAGHEADRSERVQATGRITVTVKMGGFK